VGIILGTTLCFEIERVRLEFLSDSSFLIEVMELVCRVVDATIVDRMIHIFDNGGATISFVLAESNITLHTWPEYNSLTIDLFMCKDRIDTQKVIDVISDKLGSRFINCRKFKRVIGISGEDDGTKED